MISMISVIGRNREIGKQGGLAFTSRGELPYFREVTMGHKILMGYNTYLSLPRRLDGRDYYVASREDFAAPAWVHKVPDLIKFLAEQQGSAEEIIVIGGGQIYTAALPYATRLYLTEVDATAPGADTFFPTFDPSAWTKKLVGEGNYADGLKYHRYVYNRS